MRQAEVDENSQLDNGDEQERQRDAALHEQDDEEDCEDRHGIDDLEVVVGRFDHVLHARGLADEHTGRIIFLQNGIERIDLGIHFVACDLVLRIDEQQLPFVALENRADGIRHRAFLDLFHYDFSALEEYLGIDCFSRISNYQAIGKKELMYNKNVSQKVQALSRRLEEAQDENEFFDCVTGFYKDYGVGMFGLNKAFRIQSRNDGRVDFVAINNMDAVMLDDLIGYELQKKKLVENTLAFVQGKKANNVLLFGDSGTGKSTSIKAIVNEFYDQGLRMIEIYKHQFKDLSSVIAQIKNRNYRFIIYMDDLSFEEFEVEYKFLKAVIEGGVETRPDNILIYATSNRRHLIKENWNDRSDMEHENGMHRSDTMEEKLSLVNRFGVTICYSKPSQKEYFHIVEGLARRAGITMPEEMLRAEANKWELSHGGISGRTAQQFINYLLGAMEG